MDPFENEDGVNDWAALKCVLPQANMNMAAF